MKKLQLVAMTTVLSGCPLVSNRDHAARIDVDGDGLVAAAYPGGSDCDDRDPLVGEAPLWFVDTDGDGFGTDGVTVSSCGQPLGYASRGGDCDDADAGRSPTAIEACNGIDDDCDGTRDDGFEVAPAYRDADDDGFGDPDITRAVCATEPGWVRNDTDCDDALATVSPGATEACNGIDDDCDGVVDNGLPLQPFHRDADGDGYGHSGQTVDACVAPDGYVADLGNDCDDLNADAAPDLTELCATLFDDDCDPSTVCGPDGDLLAGTVHRFTPDVTAFRAGASLAVVSTPTGALIAMGTPSRVTDDGGSDGGLYIAEAPTGPGSTALSSVTFLDSARWGFGFSTAVTHDMDGDGLGDLLVSAPFTSSDSGRVYVVSSAADGSLSPVEDHAILTIGPRSSWFYMGYDVDAGADLSGDGVPDLVVGAPLYGASMSFSGRVAVFSGAERGDVDIRDAIVEIRGTDGSLAGGAVAVLPDINGDGIADLAVGANGADAPGVNSGLVALFYGPLGTGALDLLDADVLLTGELGDDRAGFAIAAAGDVNGDGIGDLIIGAPGHSRGGLAQRGAAYIVFGSPLLSTMSLADADVVMVGPDAAGGLGGQVASAGDVDGNGLDDVLVSQPALSESGGGAMLELAPFPAVFDAGGRGTLTAVHDGHEVGRALVGGFDFNDDGYDDVIIGAPGALGPDEGAAVVVFGYE